MKQLSRLALAAAVLAICPRHASAQTAEKWHWMADGVLFATYNHQEGESRGETQFRSQNWIMASGERTLGRGQLFVNGMLSFEPMTVTQRGYSQLFQMGEAYNQLENIDRQHPHDFFSQLAAGWHTPIGSRGGLTFFGAPVGEATLGPVAFMHRLSSSENPTAPLGHHTFDSTHVVQGVVGLGLDAGPLTLEGSAFHGREPDQYRYGITPGALDSWATRLWFRSGDWIAQASYGYLHAPEELEPGNIRRATGSITWTRERVDHAASITAMYGRNKRTYTDLPAFLVEGLGRVGRTSFYTRVELLDIETEHLLFPTIVHKPHPGELVDRLNAYTAGAVRNVYAMKWLSLGLGGDVTFYNVPERLTYLVPATKQVPFYGDNPYGFHIFLRVRPGGGPFMRMWNMTMGSPMRHSGITVR
jgi:hypothetical protein